MNSLAILWAQYGPYHFARVAALKQRLGPGKVHAFELASDSSDYAWKRSAASDLITLYPGMTAEGLSFWQVFRRVRRAFADLQIDVCILPSYAPKQSLAALLAAKSLGLRTVMMNESHAGTARARGASAWAKRRLVGLFDAALLGGHPQKRYFLSLGLPEQKMFLGYDAVDNDYFARGAEAVRSRASEVREQHHLPEHYFLSLGRFVPKKNLATLVRAYHGFLAARPPGQTHLVLVGSGEQEPSLRSLCEELNLPVYDHVGASSGASAGGGSPGVHFYGFRQIDENPAFYALADAFILPSIWEEWGLVVNEAMASGLPVAVSETAGCAEDLLQPGSPPDLLPGERTRIEQSMLAQKIRRNGFVFDPHSVRELSEALLLLASSANLRAVMGGESRRIVEQFTCENFAQNALRAAEAALS